MAKLPKRFASNAIPLLICSLTVSLSGCGEDSSLERAVVHGKVTVDGEPVNDGSITFFPVAPTDGPTAGGSISNGTYTIESERGVVVGNHRVEITGRRSTGNLVTDAVTGDKVDEVKQFIPPQYNSRSTLKAEVKQGDNVLDFQLESVE